MGDAGPHIVDCLDLVAFTDQLEGLCAVFDDQQVAFLVVEDDVVAIKELEEVIRAGALVFKDVTALLVFYSVNASLGLFS